MAKTTCIPRLSTDGTVSSSNRVFTSSSSSQEESMTEWHHDTSPLEHPSPSSSVTSATCSDGTPLESSAGSKAKSKTQTGKCATVKSSRRNRSSSYIPRPRNPFMIFRSETYAQKKISSIEHDHRHISRIIAICWKSLSEEEKAPWYAKAAAEKAAHAKKYPNYQYTPTQRTQPPKKRKVRRNGPKDIERCETVALLLRQGKEGQELESALQQFDFSASILPAETEGFSMVDTDPHDGPIDTRSSMTSLGRSASLSIPAASVPVFRSPLLPPALELQLQAPQQSHDDFSVQPNAGCNHPISFAPTITPAFQLYDPALPPEPYIQAFPCDIFSLSPSFSNPFPDWSNSFRLSTSQMAYPPPLAFTESPCFSASEYTSPLDYFHVPSSSTAVPTFGDAFPTSSLYNGHTVISCKDHASGPAFRQPQHSVDKAKYVTESGPFTLGYDSPVQLLYPDEAATTVSHASMTDGVIVNFQEGYLQFQ